MRRRLWWKIYILDSHAADDRATNPIITADSFTTMLPLNVNDEDLHVNTWEEVEERQGFTDMTFCLICLELTETHRQLNFVPVKQLDQPQKRSQEEWTQRANAVTNVQRHLEEKYLSHFNLAHPFHFATRLVADNITAIMWLIVYRPLQQRLDNSPSSQRPDPGILGLAVEVLERDHQMTNDPAASGFRWLSQTYVQWHALAVTFAELCVKTEGPMVERAWAIVMPVFREASEHVADSNEGMLWRPIKKLMNRAQGLRQEYLQSRSAKPDFLASMADCSVSDQGKYGPDIGNAMLDIVQSAPQAMTPVTPPTDGLEFTPSIPGLAPYDWDSWLAATSMTIEESTRSQYNDDVDLMALRSWENFVHGFHAQDEGVTSGPNDEAFEHPSLWR